MSKVKVKRGYSKTQVKTFIRVALGRTHVLCRLLIIKVCERHCMTILLLCRSARNNSFSMRLFVILSKHNGLLGDGYKFMIQEKYV